MAAAREVTATGSLQVAEVALDTIFRDVTTAKLSSESDGGGADDPGHGG